MSGNRNTALRICLRVVLGALSLWITGTPSPAATGAVAVAPVAASPGAMAARAPQDAAGSAEPSPRVLLKVDDPVHDWGSAWQGARVEHVFRLTNPGPGPLKILEVKPDCGCTAAREDLKGRVVAAGRSVELALAVDTGKLAPGDAEKTATIVTDRSPVDVKVSMKGEVREVLSSDPGTISLRLVRDDGPPPEPLSVTFRSRVDRPIEWKGLEVEKGTVSAKCQVVEKGRVFRVLLRPLVDPDRAPRLLVDAILPRVRVDGADLELRFALSIRVQDRIDVAPSRSFFFARAVTRRWLAGGPAPVRQLTVKSLGQPRHRFHIRSARFEKGLFSARVTALEPGRRYRLEVRPLPLAPDTPRPRLLRDTLILSTDDPRVPELRLPGLAQF